MKCSNHSKKLKIYIYNLDSIIHYVSVKFRECVCMFVLCTSNMIFFQAIEQDDFEESGAVREMENDGRVVYHRNLVSYNPYSQLLEYNGTYDVFLAQCA
jgi:hypothetical protein